MLLLLCYFELQGTPGSEVEARKSSFIIKNIMIVLQKMHVLGYKVIRPIKIQKRETKNDGKRHNTSSDEADAGTH